MKRILLVSVFLALTSGLLVGCSQGAELENRINNLEARLTTVESTNKALQSRIEQLTAEDIRRTLEGAQFRAILTTPPACNWAPYRASIRFEDYNPSGKLAAP